MAQARALYERGDSYALAMYAAGLAVECILRAFKMRRTNVFDDRHDLLLLFQASGMLDVDPDTIHSAGLSAKASEATSASFKRLSAKSMRCGAMITVMRPKNVYERTSCSSESTGRSKGTC